MRDLNRVITYLTRHVIPPEEAGVLADLSTFYKKAFYTPPETQAHLWREFALLLNIVLGDPAGVPWKERVAAIVMDSEKIPEDFQELSSVHIP